MAKSYKIRTLSSYILRMSGKFKVLLIDGPRQVGKTTLLKNTQDGKRKYVSLDNPQDLLKAKTDPRGFLDIYSPPCIIDEIQYAPELFPYIKMITDNTDERGLIWMTGSQQYNLMQGVTESLAGRVVITDMLGFSIYEREGKGDLQKPFLPSPEPACTLKKRNSEDTFKVIWQGAFPDVINADAEHWEAFYNSYIRTYIERDVRQIINIGNEVKFMTFLKVAAARTGQELNLADIARDVNIDPKTAGNWLSVLKTSGLVYLLQPYFKNITKRLTKHPKLYFMDTGLASYLAGWTTPKSLETGASSGAFFETFVITEILKSYYHNGKNPQLNFYRDSDKNEIDLLIFQDGKYYPVEIKKHGTPVSNDIKAFNSFAQKEPVGFGCEICLVPNIQPLSPEVIAMSVWDI
jgi:predicted AAA+ superfamily ATPase